MKDVRQEIDRLRAEWGKRLLILGHHYQRAQVLKHVDEIGDSLELARIAASHPEAERIVFCGVHFMAESADILTGPGQTVYMPEPGAGCPMAAMADEHELGELWTRLESVGGGWLPVVYVNSTAAIKAFCGRKGGSACTSSNARKVFEWVFAQRRRVLFLPDEHLGRNTAADLGLPDEAVRLYDPRQPDGGLRDADLREVRVLVWKGFCIVHQMFTVEHVRQVREKLPNARIIVHPECPLEVVRLCDAHGSTSQIVRYVETAPDGATVVIGTELNLIERLADVHRSRITVKALAPSVCANMAKTRESSLLDLLKLWPADHAVHVSDPVATEARKALGQMLAL